MDRFSFLQFLGLQAGDDVPDARTIWDFKQLLEKDGRDGSRRLFERFGQQLQAEGLLAREGSIVDAKLRSRIRVRCEHVFGRMSQMAMDRLRTIGLLRAGQHNGLCNLVYNMDRYAFLCR